MIAMTERGRYWARILVTDVIAAFVVTLVFSGVTWRTPLHDIAAAFAIAFVFASVIGPLLALAMPALGRRIWNRLPFPINWVVAMTAMVGIAIAGSLVAIAVLTLVGYIRPRQFGDWFAGTLRISIIITLVFGVFITAYEVMRARVAHANAQAQLASLEARVQPHFLFNTLNSIAALIPDDPRGAEAMTGRLADLLRSSLDRDEPLVPLDDELRVVETYLEIEHVRFGDRLRYRIAAGEQARRGHVPRFAVQTLVENSVKYAVSARREGATISVHADALGDRLALAVEDDGPGFDVSAATEGRGLALLRDRLNSLFGRSAALAVESRPGRTTARVTMPLKLGDSPAGGRRSRQG